ncbi:conserved hypothetical protein [Tolumonas auensis DSM 9187]|uniref:Uncharacterized protein n=1 Tax=Tolumonas auensis (strain DSM 9187 / NBRC 110442 / TA 4) TaxID=595494 RepID=C4LB64_TOLAT|nr:hypothetical protein [Tolumonas auensis]ACQ94267.1 conserved hypothetical protein [Tolumonas auensis DSM 9187]
MKRILSAILLTCLLSSNALSGPFSDDLSRCLLKKTNDTDKVLLMQWIFVAISKHPDVNNFTSISKKESNLVSKNTALLIQDLVVNRCHDEAKQALKYEGDKAWGDSFKLFGEVAMSGLMKNSKVEAYMNEMDNYFDKNKLSTLGN